VQSAAYAYSSAATVTFTVGGNATFGAHSDQTFVATAAPISLGGSAPTNSTIIHLLTGANSRGTFNQDFTSTADCAPGAGIVPAGSINAVARKYGCRYQTAILNSDVYEGDDYNDEGPGTLQATGTVIVTDTTMTGTLTIVSTTDEPTGGTTTISTSGGVTTRLGTSVGNGSNGYNYRSADGSPFGNYWQGITTAGTYTLNLTGTFNSSTWTVTGGTATFNDPNFACQQGGFGGDDRGTLCTASTTAGGFQPNGAQFSWGMDLDGINTGSGTQQIPVVDQLGNPISSLAGVFATINVGGGGALSSTASSEVRRALGNTAGCPLNIRYDTTSNLLTCGNLTGSMLTVTGNIAPDTDGDGRVDPIDNCRLTSNATPGATYQLDANGDGYGNICDGDVNNSGLVTSTDFNILRSVLNQSSGASANAAQSDMNGSGLVTSTDFNLLRARLNTAPGPSGLSCAAANATGCFGPAP
jgi:hypothetical protein